MTRTNNPVVGLWGYCFEVKVNDLSTISPGRNFFGGLFESNRCANTADKLLVCKHLSSTSSSSVAQALAGVQGSCLPWKHGSIHLSVILSCCPLTCPRRTTGDPAQQM